MIQKISGLLIFLLVLNFTGVGVCQQQEEKAEPVVKDLSFDKETGAVSYELTVPAWVRIRIGVGDGPLYRTLCDWEKRPVGKHKEVWDGMDPSGTFKLVGREDLAFTFNYFTSGDEYLSDIQTFIFQPPADKSVGRHLPNLQINQMHKNHPREFCHEPKIRLSLPKKIRKTKDNFYVIKNKTPIEISLDDEDRAWFRSERYSIHIFLDDVFVQGELDGYSPYTWIFDPRGLNKGKHLIVVNLAGFNDHYGIASLPVYVIK